MSGLCPDKFAWKPCTSGHRPDATPFAKMLFGGFFATPKYSEKGMSVTQKIKSVIEKVIWMTDFIMSFTEKVIWLPKMQSQALKSPFPSLT